MNPVNSNLHQKGEKEKKTQKPGGEKEIKEDLLGGMGKI